MAVAIARLPREEDDGAEDDAELSDGRCIGVADCDSAGGAVPAVPDAGLSGAPPGRGPRFLSGIPAGRPTGAGFGGRRCLEEGEYVQLLRYDRHLLVVRSLGLRTHLEGH